MVNNPHFNANSIGASSAPIDRGQVMGDVNDAFAKAMRDAANLDPYSAKKEKIFGMEVDPMMALGVNAIVNNAAHMFMTLFAPRSFDLTNNLLKNHLGVQSNSVAAKIAGVATLALSVGAKGAKQFSQIYGSLSEDRAKHAKLATAIAPVLDELKDSHSVGALMRVGRAGIDKTGNDMIWSHRKRLSTIAHNNTMGYVIDLAMNAGPNLLLDLPIAKALAYKGTDVEGHFRDVISTRSSTPAANTAGSTQTPQDMKAVGVGMLNTATPMIAEMWKKNNKAKLQALPSQHSALEMLIELQEQVTNDAKEKQFYPPGNKSKGMSLEHYIAQVMVQHQKEMSLFDPEQAEIREALMDDLALVAKPMAKAVRDGTISALSLVRLIGENHVIKSHGRVVASADEVEAQIERMAGKTTTKLHHDPKDYYGTASFTKDDLKSALKSLDGDERLLFASWFSDAILEDAGISTSEIKNIREATAKSYETGLLDAISGLAAQSDAALKDAGMAMAEIKQLRHAQQRIERDGAEAVHQLRESPAQPHGVERVLANVAVAQVLGDKTYVGKLVTKGREALAHAESHGERADSVERDHAHPPRYRKGLGTHGGHVETQHSRSSQHEDDLVALSK